MIEHRYHLDIPHDPKRIWAIINDYDRWAEIVPMVPIVGRHLADSPDGFCVQLA